MAGKHHLVGRLGWPLRNDDAHIFKYGFFDYVFIVGTNKHAHINFFAQIQVCYLLGDEWLTEFGNTHRIGIPFSFQLNDIGISHFCFYLFGGSRSRSSELKRGKAIAMHNSIYVS